MATERLTSCIFFMLSPFFFLGRFYFISFSVWILRWKMFSGDKLWRKGRARTSKCCIRFEKRVIRYLNSCNMLRWHVSVVCMWHNTMSVVFTVNGRWNFKNLKWMKLFLIMRLLNFIWKLFGNVAVSQLIVENKRRKKFLPKKTTE